MNREKPVVVGAFQPPWAGQFNRVAVRMAVLMMRGDRERVRKLGQGSRVDYGREGGGGNPRRLARAQSDD